MTPWGVGNQSLIYSIDEQEISFCDHFDVMSKLYLNNNAKPRDGQFGWQNILIFEQFSIYPI